MKRIFEGKIPNPKRQKFEYVNINWKSATSFYNFMNDDPILDFFQTNRINTKKQLLDYIEKSKPSNTFYKKNFPKALAEKGYQFEELVFNNLETKAKEKNFKYTTICNSYKDIFKYESYKNTKKSIYDGIDIIFHGVLKNKINKTYGQTDIIMKGNALLSLFDIIPEEINNENYYIIDVKCSNLSTLANTNNLSNLKFYDCYRAQLYIYNQCLHKITGKENFVSFLLPKKITNLNTTIENTEFRKLVRVYLFDKSIEEKINQGITWNNELYYNKNFSLIPPSHNNLYPNMKNQYDNGAGELKRYLAEKNGEITMLYYCGVEQRNNALKQGIKSFYDVCLTPEILGFKKESAYYNIIKGMLECIHQNKNIIPKENNVFEWRKETPEVYIDFETFTDENNYNWLYLIGILYEYTNEKGIKYYKYKSFFLDKLDKIHEKENIIEFLKFIKSLNIEKTWHWGNFEYSLITKKVMTHLIDVQLPVLYDMLEIFKNKNHPILFKNVFNFSIKSFYKYLRDERHISYDYNELSNGFDSMDIAREYYQTRDEEIKDNILYYNKIDCKLMYDILRYIRNS